MSYRTYQPGLPLDRDERLKIPVKHLEPPHQDIAEIMQAFGRWLQSAKYGEAYRLWCLIRDEWK